MNGPVKNNFKKELSFEEIFKGSNRIQPKQISVRRKSYGKIDWNFRKRDHQK